MTGTLPPLNAFLDYPQVAVPHAESGPLAGLRLAVKDIFDVAGYPTGWGNPQRAAEASAATETAPAVQALLDAGARFVGKTQTDELAFSLMGQNAHFPFPVNPAAPDRVTGGSSSGSAAAVAGGLADIAIGSDTGGSIRAPASFCGLIGLRTTHGRIPLDGAMPLAPSLDTFGWFARDMDVYETVAKVLLGFSPFEGEMGGSPEGVASGSTAGAPSTAAATLPSRGRGQTALRLAALDALVLGESEAAEYERMVGIAASVLGAPVAAPPLSHSPDDLYWCFRRIQGFEAWAAHGAWISAADRGLGPGVRERFDYGATIDGGTVAAETRRRDAFRAELAALLGADGVLVLPTVPGAAPLKDARFDDLQTWRERALKLLCWSGLSGFPQITLPLGQIDGAPFGLSLLGPAGSDLHLIDLGRTILEAAGKA
ncbi:amidase family protein [Mesorhizobium sp. CN5-321]|uniref:amidase family protein n=1 Tax=Mesorhizobium hunchu TaxID=3157708 RepID=UPI0032B85C36